MQLDYGVDTEIWYMVYPASFVIQFSFKPE